jgi:nicotinamide-nucleotide amidase
MNPRSVEILNTGSELLLGNVRDAHLSWFGKELFPLGLRISRQTTVPDGTPIKDALLESFARSGIVIVTGGLGPTTDDITRDIVAELLGRTMIPHPETLERIQERCRRRGFAFQERMALQAMAPEGAVVLPNENGTAPGIYLPATENISGSTPHIFLLPGPPRELQPMARNHVLPLLASLVEGASNEECRIYKVVGMGESLLEAKVGLALSARGDIEVGYCARPNEVDFRLIGPKALLDEVEPLVLAAVGDHLVSDEEESMERIVVSLLCARGATLATAESCTGGLLANRITDIPGASTVFVEGFVTYSNDSKTALLGVPAGLIERHGAVSEVVARAMAEGALAKSGARYALSTTGIAGPDGGTPEKPVGTVWLALAEAGKETESWRENLLTDRITFKQAATQSALDRLRKRLRSVASDDLTLVRND